MQLQGNWHFEQGPGCRHTLAWSAREQQYIYFLTNPSEIEGNKLTPLVERHSGRCGCEVEVDETV